MPTKKIDHRRSHFFSNREPWKYRSDKDYAGARASPAGLLKPHVAHRTIDNIDWDEVQSEVAASGRHKPSMPKMPWDK